MYSLTLEQLHWATSSVSPEPSTPRPLPFVVPPIQNRYMEAPASHSGMVAYVVFVGHEVGVYYNWYVYYPIYYCAFLHFVTGRQPTQQSVITPRSAGRVTRVMRKLALYGIIGSTMVFSLFHYTTVMRTNPLLVRSLMKYLLQEDIGHRI